MEFTTWSAYFLATCMLSISPGAGALVCMNHSMTFGMRKALITIIGLEVGGIIILTISGIGLGSAILASEYMFSSVKIIGAVYLIYLGIVQWITPTQTIISNESIGQTLPKSNFNILLTGILTNLTNPKGVIFMVAMLPQFISQTKPLLEQFLILAITMVSVDIIVMYLYATFALQMGKYLQNPKVIQWPSRVMGGLLIAMGTSLFFAKQQPIWN